uniref:Ig-like domain-containing protein n=1 Tax=Oncorhynchus mykiss TaxID=8022 RepID=A0A8C7NVP3_ONCMY
EDTYCRIKDQPCSLTIHAVCRFGADVSLLCDNVVNSDCSLIMWLHSRESFLNAIQEVFNGKVSVNSKRAKKLSVDADCSLHIHNVTAEDAGRYTCRILKHQNPFSDTDTYLSVLTSEYYSKPDRPVTIRCSLHTNEGPGNCRLFLNSEVHLSWMDETGRKLQGDSRYQLTGPRCDITLNMTFQKEDNNRKWTCTLTDKGKVKISIDFTFSGMCSCYHNFSINQSVNVHAKTQILKLFRKLYPQYSMLGK